MIQWFCDEDCDWVSAMLENLSRKQKVALGEILGTIPSDAYLGLTDKGLYNYMLCAKDKGFIEYIIQDFLKLGVNAVIHRRQSGLWYVEVSRKWFEEFLPYLEKRDDYWVFSSEVVDSQDQEFQSAVIRSFADADGTATCTIRGDKYYSRRVAIYNKSRELLSQLQIMLNSLGITCYVRMDREARTAGIKGQLVEFPTVYSLRVTHHENLIIFQQKVNFRIKRKKKKLNEIINSYRRIGRDYTKEDYQRALSLYRVYSSYQEVSEKMGIPANTVRNWISLGVKPRILKIPE